MNHSSNGLPSRLSKVTNIGVYSPSGPFSDVPFKLELFERGLQRIRSRGFEVVESARCRQVWHHMSALPKERAADLHSLLANQSVSAVLPSIGGHVAAQMLQHLDFDAIAGSGAAVFGFSDNSIIPLILSATTGQISFHSLCDVTFGFGRFTDDGRVTEQGILNVLRSQRFDLHGTGQTAVIQGGVAEGKILGGNLRAILTLAGTRWWPDWTDTILFWEAGDSMHAVQQDLTQLANCGVFDKLAGMVIGRASRLKEDFYSPDQIAPLDMFLLDVLKLRNRFPIVVESDIGHDVENITIPLGALSQLKATEDGVSWTTPVQNSNE
ncbi:MAG: S66 peptidase family protein [Thermoanaerobaculia bacterium]